MTVNAQLRQLAPMMVVLAVTIAGFFGARALTERDARRESDHQAELAATRVRDRVDQAANVVDGIRRFLVGPPGAGGTAEEFVDIGSRWLGPLGLPAAAWTEQVAGSDRTRYERRTGLAIVRLTSSGGVAPAAPRGTFLPATMVTRAPPLTVAGLDLDSVPGVAAAVRRPATAFGVSATPLVEFAKGPTGLFLVQSAQRLDRGLVEQGFVVLFVPASWLLSTTADTGSTPNLRLTVGGTSTGHGAGGATVGSKVMTAGQQFEVFVPRRGVHGAAAGIPWIILSAGFVFAALAGALRVNSARRVRAKAEVDRLFTLSPDLIVVVGFDGYFKRVNPAFEATLGYTEEEALARPVMNFVHPEDRERTEQEGGVLRSGDTLVSFENRYICKDGTYRWIEWTATPVRGEDVIYCVGRDVTERRQAEHERSAAEEKYRTLAQAQASLRRVATLVARRASPPDVFTAAAVEVNRLLGSDYAALVRYEPDAMVTVLAIEGISEADVPVGLRISLEGDNAIAAVLRTGNVSWSDTVDAATGPVAELARTIGVRFSVGAPIVVEGRVWGVIVVMSTGGRLPVQTERRLADFTDLVATGIADAESRAALGRLAAEQAALRRVATLVAQGVPSGEVFSALADEVRRLLDAQAAIIARLEPDGTVVIVAHDGDAGDRFEVGEMNRIELDPDMLITTVLRTGRSARNDGSNERERLDGIVDRVGVPIVVEGALWGAIVIWTARDRFPHDTEQRMAEFTELAATAIANAEGRSELAASRTRIVTAADEMRRRIERDLHDGTQQRLVSLGLELRMAQATLPVDVDEARRKLTRVADELDAANNELRELSHGIHPAILSEGGLGPALRTLARRSAIPVQVEIAAESRLPEPIGVAAYYVVSESLTNAAKHASATVVKVAVDERDGVLCLTIRDDGVGGANVARGTGLIGLRDRVEALGGSILISSPIGDGTRIAVELPLEVEGSEAGWIPGSRAMI